MSTSISQILSWISLISFILAGISLVVAIFIWFKFQIPSVINDLSGRTAKKSIQRLRESNEKSGKKVFKSSTTNIERGMLTDTMPDSEILKDESESKKASIGTKYQKTSLQNSKALQRKEPVKQKEIEETSLLLENQTSNNQNLETEILKNETLIKTEQVESFKTEETGLLIEENVEKPLGVEKTAFLVHKRVGVELVMLEDVMFVHTDEVIR